MKNTKNSDYLNKAKTPGLKTKTVKSSRSFSVDGLVRRERKVLRVKKVRQKQKPAFVVPFKANKAPSQKFIFLQKFSLKHRVPIMAAVAALFLAFGGGVWATLSTGKIAAYNGHTERRSVAN